MKVQSLHLHFLTCYKISGSSAAYGYFIAFPYDRITGTVPITPFGLVGKVYAVHIDLGRPDGVVGEDVGCGGCTAHSQRGIQENFVTDQQAGDFIVVYIKGDNIHFDGMDILIGGVGDVYGYCGEITGIQ